ncbi:hypothetical protein F2Q68_00025553 [Brassica cretica]|uniref:Uncharacterized protein n=1 Tax=Brassica cretica TaxID=69181 RepID=A0A8S9ICB7_BRACR|nr:hypothetical protein F2Q68_00025553 [Brassica cretica]
MWTVWSLENDLVTQRLHEDPGIIGDGGTEALLGSLDRVWDPEVPVRPRGLYLGPEGTVLCLPRQDYYRYLFGFRILPLGSWLLSSSYVVFYFCRKSLTGLEGAGVGTFHIGTLGTPMHLRLHRGFRIGGLWRPDPARMPL